MTNTESQKVQMACVQLILKLDGENMEIKVMSFGEESLPQQQRDIVEATVKTLYNIFQFACETITGKEQSNDIQ